MGVLVVLACGCASKREVGLPTVHAADVRLHAGGASTLEDDIGGPWQVVTGESGVFADPPDPLVDDVLVPEAPVGRPPTPVARRAPVARPRPVERKVVVVPRRRAAQPARPEGKKLQRSAEQLAREHFLDYPTHVRAAKITFYCPAAYAAGVRLTGAAVDDLGGGSRRAQGRARLLLRELTLEADRITLKVRAEAEPDLQLLARGDVHVVSDVRGNVMRESGLRSLMITNDRVVPLR